MFEIQHEIEINNASIVNQSTGYLDLLFVNMATWNTVTLGMDCIPSSGSGGMPPSPAKISHKKTSSHIDFMFLAPPLIPAAESATDFKWQYLQTPNVNI